MSIKSKLLTSAAALTLASGAAFAQSNDTTLATDAEIKTETSAEAGAYAPGWDENLDTAYGDIADRQVAELIGMNVVTQGGDDVGEVDNFVIMENQLKVVVGVGGFIGIGEHDVALSLSDLTYEGDRLVIPFTAEELEAMPEYTEELEQTALNETDTFRTRGDMEAPADQDSEMAATQLETDVEPSENEAEVMAEGDAELSDEDSEAMQMADGTAESNADEATAPSGEEVAAAEEAAGDEDTMTEEVAEAEKGEIEQEAEELVAEADAATEEATEEVADAGAEAEAAIEEGSEEVADAADDAAAETEEMAENAAAETEAAVEEGADEVADAADATGEAIDEGAEDVATATEDAAKGAGEWFSKLDDEFAEIADWTTADIEGKAVATANGDVIGEIDDLGMQNDKLMAVVGIGGFLGLGEHDVALEINEMSWDGEKFIADGYSEEQLKGMAEYDPETIDSLEADVTLRSQANL